LDEDIHNTMATAVHTDKSNIGVFTNPKHELWIAPAEPALEAVQGGESLKEGQVTIAIKSTGICGSVRTCSYLNEAVVHDLVGVMFTFGMRVASGP
jgi:threonine dehydrogenase-like Zn-dependent dehydrogenase